MRIYSESHSQVKHINEINHNFFVKDSLHSQLQDKSDSYQLSPKQLQNARVHSNITLNKAKRLLKELAYKLIDPKYKTALMIFPLMVDKYAHIDGWLDLSHIQIAKIFRISEITSVRCMKLFHQLGLIRKQRRGLKQTNLYTFDWEILASIQNMGLSPLNYHRSNLLSKPKGLRTYNKNKDKNSKEFLEGKKEIPIKESPPDKNKPFELRNFNLSKKNVGIFESYGLESYLQQIPFVEWFITLQEGRLHNSTDAWTHKNSNYLFEKFIREELELRQKQGIRYINPVRRAEWFKKKLAGITILPPSVPAEGTIAETKVDIKSKYITTRADIDAENERIRATWSN